MAEQLAVADLQVDIKQIPLKQPFVTALHRVDAVNAVRVTVRLANGVTGIGTCTPNEKVTGDSLSSARAVIEETIKPLVLGKNLTDWKELLNTVKTSIVHNAPAKAAVKIALYNTRANLFGLTLSQLLGGKGGSVETDYTISIGKAEQMIANAQKMVDQGFKTLKLKLGAGHLKQDIKLVEDLAYATGPMVHLRLDMNQAWDVRQTMQAAEYLLISQDFTTQCLKSLLLRPFSKFKIIFFEL
jgi:L-Ala-D/L-Glu epimerase